MRGLGFRVSMEAVMIRFEPPFQCMAACEVLPWPDCGWPSNTFAHATPSEAANPSKPALSRVQDLNSVRSILVNNITIFTVSIPLHLCC